MTPSLLLAVAAGGFLGAPCRYLLDRAVSERIESDLPWGTFLVNISGAFLLGFLAGIALADHLSPFGTALLGTGFCGAYTTFSTYMVDAVVLVRDGHPATAAIYVVTSVVAGLAGVWAGITGARLVLRLEAWIQAEV